MSESTFPFSGGTAVAEPPATGAPAGAPYAPDNRNRLLAVGGVAVVVILAVVGYFLFFSGDPAPTPKPPTPIAPAAPAADAPAPVAPAAGSKKLTHASFGRDPFHALIVEQPAAPAGTGSDTTTTTSTGTTTDTATTGGTTSTGVTAPAQTASHTFRVVSVSPNNGSISVKVDGKTYSNLHAGEVFATYFKVVLISGTTNAFQYGEEKFNVLGTKRLTIA